MELLKIIIAGTLLIAGLFLFAFGHELLPRPSGQTKEARAKRKAIGYFQIFAVVALIVLSFWIAPGVGSIDSK